MSRTMNINNLNYRPPTSCSEPNKQERTTGIPMEDWLRGCVYHDGRKGEVTLPTDKVIEIADYIQATRTGITDGIIYLPLYEESRTMTKQEAIALVREVSNYMATRPEIDEAIDMAIEALQQEPIIRCKDCKYWHEWENGTGSCHRSDIMWVGSDYYDYCSFAERKEQ